jgi:hypothetical protein
VGRIVNLKKDAVAYGVAEMLPGYARTPPFGVSTAERKGGAINKLLREIAKTPTKSMADWALWFAGVEEAHPGTFTWKELRPMLPFRRPPAYQRIMDCSTFATLMAWIFGLPDPNGRGYDGTGNTTTLIQHGSKVAIPAASDFVFYTDGSEPVSHVAVAVSRLEVVSMGCQGDPRKRVLANCSDPALRLVEVRRYA